MGTFLAVLTYDLTKDDDFNCVKSALQEVGLADELTGSEGKAVKLPNTTLAGEFTGESAKSVQDWLSPKVEKSMKGCSAKGKFFLLVTSTYSWIHKTFDHH